MSYEPGTRVFAVMGANDDTVQLLGFGTYVGKEIPPGHSHFSQEWIESARHAIRVNDDDPWDPEAWFDHVVARGEMTREDADRQLAEGRRRAAAPPNNAHGHSKNASTNY